MPNQTNVNTGNAGEYFVAGELERRGFTVAVPMSNVKDFDILAINRETYEQFAIQVKTTGYKQKVWTLSSKNENLVGDNIIYVFVSLNELDVPEYHIVPSGIVAKTITDSYWNWYNTPGKKGQQHNHTSIRKYEDKEDRYLDKWYLLRDKMNLQKYVGKEVSIVDCNGKTLAGKVTDFIYADDNETYCDSIIVEKFGEFLVEISEDEIVSIEIKSEKVSHKLLTDFIPKLQEIDIYAKLHPEKQEGDGSMEHPFQMPFYVYDEEVSAFVEEVYKFGKKYPEYELEHYRSTMQANGIAWDEVALKNYPYEQANAQMVMVLIYAVIRAERFCDGALLAFLKEGYIERWLMRLKEIDEVD